MKNETDKENNNIYNRKGDVIMNISEALQKIVYEINEYTIEKFYGRGKYAKGNDISVGDLCNNCLDIAESVENETDKENLIDLVNAVFDGY